MRFIRFVKKRLWKGLILIIALVLAPGVYAETLVPDYKVSKIMFSNIPAVGTQVEVYAEVENIGETDLLQREFYVSFDYKKFSQDWLYHIGDVLVESIPSGEKRTISVKWTPPSYGEYTIIVKADWGESINETNEENNEMS